MEKRGIHTNHVKVFEGSNKLHMERLELSLCVLRKKERGKTTTTNTYILDMISLSAMHPHSYVNLQTTNNKIWDRECKAFLRIHHISYYTRIHTTDSIYITLWLVRVPIHQKNIQSATPLVRNSFFCTEYNINAQEFLLYYKSFSYYSIYLYISIYGI